MGKIVVTFKLEDGIYSKLKEIAEKEGRGISEIMRESLTDWLQNKKHVSTPDFICFSTPCGLATGFTSSPPIGSTPCGVERSLLPYLDVKIIM